MAFHDSEGQAVDWQIIIGRTLSLLKKQYVVHYIEFHRLGRKVKGHPCTWSNMCIQSGYSFAECRVPRIFNDCHDNEVIFNEALVISTMKPYDPNQQTALDMDFARNRTSITIENVRNFLHRKSLPEDSTSTGSITLNCARWTRCLGETAKDN